MIAALRRQFALPELTEQLVRLAENAPPAAPVSLCLNLGQHQSDWLHTLPKHGPFWYRAQPAKNEYRLGIGHAFQVASAGPNRFAALDNAFSGLCQHWRGTGQPLAFSGFAFDSSSNSPLPNALLAIPSILLESLDGQCTATLSAPAGRLKQAITEWQRSLQTPARSFATSLQPSRPEMLLERAWMARVNAALRAIEQGRVDKLVLSRCRKLTAKQPFSPADILGQLIAQQPSSLVYAHGNGQQCFLGATPERLVRLRDGQLAADALAGTAWPGSADLSGGKNRHEQSLVVDAVCAALVPFCAGQAEVGDACEHSAGHLLHLRSRITATVRPGTRLLELVRALHPTPAVGGFPAEAALAWLEAHGEQRPGWYSGGFGMINRNGDGEFSVALRSALLDGNLADLQAGAGIVAGSDPELELAETEAKLAVLQAALSPATAAPKAVGRIECQG